MSLTCYIFKVQGLIWIQNLLRRFHTMLELWNFFYDKDFIMVKPKRLQDIVGSCLANWGVKLLFWIENQYNWLEDEMQLQHPPGTISILGIQLSKRIKSFTSLRKIN